MNGESITTKLKTILGSSDIVSDGGGLGAFEVDRLSPKWVVFPKTREEVAKIVDLCRKESLSILPWGNGTKVKMGFVPRSVDLILSTSKLNRVVDQDCENLTITLEAGNLLSDVQGRLRKEGIGYFIPLDPPYTEKATLGGILAANSNGSKRLLYGTVRDLVLGMKVVLADGRVVSCGGKTVKNVSGYDLTKLFIGSLGTLGIIVEATLRLLPLPEEERTFVASFSRLEDAFEVVRAILQSQLVPSSVEVFNKEFTKETQVGLFPGKEDYILMIGFEGVKESVQRQAEEIQRISARFHPRRSELFEGNEQARLWTAVRDSGLTLENRLSGAVIVKMNVPISKTLQGFLHFEAAARQEGLRFVVSSHAGTGILQMGLLLDDSNAVVDRAAKLIDRLTLKAVELEGNLVVEAAPASIKKRVNVWGQEGSGRAVFRQLKSQLDPSALFSPGRFVGGI